MKEYPNPLVEQRADPWCCLHTDGFYYFTGSVPEYDRIELRRSATLGGLADCETRVIWKKHESGVMSHNIWAPELHYINGKWYIYFCAGRAEEHFRLGCFVLECTGQDPLNDEWIERGQIDTGWEGFALDMTTFMNKGKQYVIWAQKPPEKSDINSNLYIAECADPCTLKSNAVMITTPEYDWETHKFKVNEGAAVLKHGEKIFVTYSASDTGRAYCMGMLWADCDADLLDPASWTKSDSPVFKTCEENSQFGPGHNSFTTDGGENVLVYHCRSYSEIEGDPLYDPNRHARAKTFEFDADGMPVFGVPPKDSE